MKRGMVIGSQEDMRYSFERWKSIKEFPKLLQNVFDLKHNDSKSKYELRQNEMGLIQRNH